MGRYCVEYRMNASWATAAKPSTGLSCTTWIFASYAEHWSAACNPEGVGSTDTL
jgi:hypothetical protein